MPDPLLLHGPPHGPDTVYEPLNEWLLPWRVTGFQEEYDALTAGAALVDASLYGLIEIAGADRLAWLHRLLTNDLARLTPGTGCRAALLSSTAKLVAELTVLADPQRLWLLCDAHGAGALTRALERYAFSDDVQVRNHERSVCVLALEGPKVRQLLPRLLEEAPSLTHPCDHIVTPRHGLSLRWIRQSLIAGPGVMLWCPSEEAVTCWRWLRDAGAPLGLKAAGWEAVNTARIEAGIPWMGVDMDETTLLPETGLEALLASDTKGCYSGQEIVARMATYGSASKKLMGLRLDGREVPRGGDRLLRGTEDVGWVTSACNSPALRRPIAMGYVKRGAYEPGVTVEVARGEVRLPATVCARPFIPPNTG